MREVSELYLFPNISENLNRSLLKIKSIVLGMIVARATARQAAKEAQADSEGEIDHRPAAETFLKAGKAPAGAQNNAIRAQEGK